METVYLSFGNNHVQNKNISKYSWKDRSFDFLYHMKMESVVFFNCRFLLLHLFRYVFVLHVVWWLYLNKKAKCLLILVILLNVLLLETVLAKCLPPKSWCVVSFVCEMISRSQWTFCFLIINHKMNCWYFLLSILLKRSPVWQSWDHLSRTFAAVCKAIISRGLTFLDTLSSNNTSPISYLSKHVLFVHRNIFIIVRPATSTKLFSCVLPIDN